MDQVVRTLPFDESSVSTSQQTHASCWKGHMVSIRNTSDLPQTITSTVQNSPVSGKSSPKILECERMKKALPLVIESKKKEEQEAFWVIDEQKKPSEEVLSAWAELKSLVDTISSCSQKKTQDFEAINQEIVRKIRFVIQSSVYQKNCTNEKHDGISYIHRLVLASYITPDEEKKPLYHNLSNALTEGKSEGSPEDFYQQITEGRKTAQSKGLVENDGTLSYVIQNIPQAKEAVKSENLVPFFKYDPKLAGRNIPRCVFTRDTGEKTIVAATPTVGNDIAPEFRALMQALENRRHMSSDELKADPFPYTQWVYTCLQNEGSSNEGDRVEALKGLAHDFPGVFHLLVVSLDSDVMRDGIHGKKSTVVQKQMKSHKPATTNSLKEMQETVQGWFLPMIQREHLNQDRICKDLRFLIATIYQEIAENPSNPASRHDMDVRLAFRELAMLSAVRYFQQIFTNGNTLLTTACKECIDRGGQVNAAFLWALQNEEKGKKDALATLMARPALTRSRLILADRVQPFVSLTKYPHDLVHDAMELTDFLVDNNKNLIGKTLGDKELLAAISEKATLSFAQRSIRVITEGLRKISLLAKRIFLTLFRKIASLSFRRTNDVQAQKSFHTDASRQSQEQALLDASLEIFIGWDKEFQVKDERDALLENEYFRELRLYLSGWVVNKEIPELSDIDHVACNTTVLRLLRKICDSEEYTACSHREEYPSIALVHRLVCTLFCSSDPVSQWHKMREQDLGVQTFPAEQSDAKNAYGKDYFAKKLYDERELCKKKGCVENSCTFDFITSHLSSMFVATTSSVHVPSFEYDPLLHGRNLPGVVFHESYQVAAETRDIKTVMAATVTVGNQISPECRALAQALENRRKMSSDQREKDPFPYTRLVYTTLQNERSRDEGPRVQAIQDLAKEFPDSFKVLSLSLDGIFRDGIKGHELHKLEASHETYADNDCDVVRHYIVTQCEQAGFDERAISKAESMVQRAYQVVSSTSLTDAEKRIAFRELAFMGVIQFFQGLYSEAHTLAITACKECIDRGGQINAGLAWAKTRDAQEGYDRAASIIFGRPMDNRDRLILPDRLYPLLVLMKMPHQEVFSFLEHARTAEPLSIGVNSYIGIEGSGDKV